MLYSYVRITNKGCESGPDAGGADIDAVGAIESADPVVVTTTTPATSTTTVPDISTTTTSIIEIIVTSIPATTTTPADTTTTTIRDCSPLVGETPCGDNCCPPLTTCCSNGSCCDAGYACSFLYGCVEEGDIRACLSERLYGEYSEESEQLRNYRDNVLSLTPEGQEIIRLYYEWSPTIVNAMEDDEEFKEEVKEMVDGVLELIE